ncbi:MAG: NAD-dependent epimerase/dehydratase family protein, partial [Flavobacteriales bacterium]
MKDQTWLITGATGLVGTALVRQLLSEGHRVKTLGRSSHPHPKVESHLWHPAQGLLPQDCVRDVDVVVHLAGASVGQRWTHSHRRAILESRVQGTSLLREALVEVGFNGVWIQASAVGFYGNAAEPVNESSPRGSGFLADVVEAWEGAAGTGLDLPCRSVVMRLGLVLAPEGGTLAKLLPIYRWGLGAPLGSGRQYMSWIHL